MTGTHPFFRGFDRPVTLAQWDFSWLERRWPGGGFEDWDRALDELHERGYDAIRIDPFPHLLAAGPDREWELLPLWTVHEWGSPRPCRVRVLPDLIRFLEKCAARKIRVAFCGWFRKDREDVRLRIGSPLDLSRAWRAALDEVRKAGLLDLLLYVDLCNEFPWGAWAPFVNPDENEPTVRRASPEGARWMREAAAALRPGYPDLPLTFSMASEFKAYRDHDVSPLDFLELHVWMAHWDFSDFGKRAGYGYQRFDTAGYDALAKNGEPLYRAERGHWLRCQEEAIRLAALWSEHARKPLVTAEGWGLIECRDWPGLDWGWVKELCEIGIQKAAATGRWIGMATSQFSAPQFKGMWQDAAWHRRMNEGIKGLEQTKCI